MTRRSKPFQRFFDLRQMTSLRGELLCAPIAPHNPLPPPAFGQSENPWSQLGPDTKRLSCGRHESSAAGRRTAPYAVRLWNTSPWLGDYAQVDDIRSRTPLWSRVELHLAKIHRHFSGLWAVGIPPWVCSRALGSDLWSDRWQQCRY